MVGGKGVSHCEVFSVEEGVGVLQFNRNLGGWPELERTKALPAVVDFFDIEGNVHLNKFQKSQHLLLYFSRRVVT